MIRHFIKPAYSHAPWKNPKYPPGCMCTGKASPAKVLGAKVLGTKVLGAKILDSEAKKGKVLAVKPTITQGCNTFPLIAGFTTFLRILKILK